MAKTQNSVSDNPVNGALNGTSATAESSLPSMGDLAGMLDGHKGKLAIGVAATLGLMVFYSWREKKLAAEDPEAHALHQKSKAIVKAAETRTGRRREALADEREAAARKAGAVKDTLPR